MIKLIAITLTVGLTIGTSVGWYAKGRDVKADQLEASQAVLTEFHTIAQDALDGLQKSWEHQAQLNYDRLVFIGKLKTEDDKQEKAVLAQIRENNRELQEIMQKFAMAGDLGACQFTPEFVELWNEASRSTATRPASINEYETADVGNIP